MLIYPFFYYIIIIVYLIDWPMVDKERVCGNLCKTGYYCIIFAIPFGDAS